MRKSAMPQYAVKIINKLRLAGYDAFAVGGCVRDTVMGRRPNDWDVASSAPWEATAKLFRKAVPTGAKYGTVTVFAYGGQCEVTTFRKDGEYRDSRRPENVEFVDDITEDLSRRDFTVNAMAMSPSGEIFDIFGGREDIENKIIRCVGDARVRFEEDALRMFRALRFAAQLGFGIEEETFAAIREKSYLAADLSAERVMAETEKMLMSPRTEVLTAAIECGLYSAFIPQGKAVDGSKIAALPKNAQLRWCAFAAMAAGDRSGEFLKQLRLPKHTVKLASLCAEKKLPRDEGEIRVFIAEMGEEAAVCAAAAAEACGRAGAVRKVKKLIREGNYTNVSSLAVTGNDLIDMGIRGEEIGKWLSYLAKEVTLSRIDNEKSVLIERIKEK